MSEPERDPTTPTPASDGVSWVPVAVTIVSSLSMGGALGVAIGASKDDFPFGLKIGFSIGAAISALVYWFALRDRRRDR